MFNPQTMSVQEECDARDKTFYLVKKYTSYTFLDQARSGYQAFLDAFARQLNDPGSINSPNPKEQRNYTVSFATGFYEERYIGLLEEMIPLEEGLNLLRTTAHKEEAYRTILSNEFAEQLWGRGSSEWGLDDDLFYIALGLRRHTYDARCNTIPAKHEAYVLEVAEAEDRLMALKRSSFEYDWWLSDEKRVAYHWTYESFFDSDSAYGRSWPPISYPPSLPPCPSKNTSREGQIWSGEEIPTTGIWEPWFVEDDVSNGKESLLGGLIDRLKGKTKPEPEAESKPAARFTGKVGCPNYFLAGSTAFEYEMEGTDKKAKVAWRLLWEDTRYLDGTIPEEENDYLVAPETVDTAVLTARPGDPCPESGEWYAVNWEDKRMLLQKGEQMPGPEFSTTGAVIWHLRKEKP